MVLIPIDFLLRAFRVGIGYCIHPRFDCRTFAWTIQDFCLTTLRIDFQSTFQNESAAEACGKKELQPTSNASCGDYITSVFDTMRGVSFKLTHGWLVIIAAVMVSDILVYCGFGLENDKMNKCVRDSTFNSLLRQEISVDADLIRPKKVKKGGWWGYSTKK